MTQGRTVTLRVL